MMAVMVHGALHAFPSMAALAFRSSTCITTATAAAPIKKGAIVGILKGNTVATPSTTLHGRRDSIRTRSARLTSRRDILIFTKKQKLILVSNKKHRCLKTPWRSWSNLGLARDPDIHSPLFCFRIRWERFMNGQRVHFTVRFYVGEHYGGACGGGNFDPKARKGRLASMPRLHSRQVNEHREVPTHF